MTEYTDIALSNLIFCPMMLCVVCRRGREQRTQGGRGSDPVVVVVVAFPIFRGYVWARHLFSSLHSFVAVSPTPSSEDIGEVTE